MSNYYFFPCLELANIVELAIKYLNETGIVVTSITSDNASSNVAMFNFLGARVSNAANLKVTLDILNSICEPICVVIDPSHVIKLVRNCIGDLKILYTSDGGEICWKYLESLHRLQTEEGLHLSNKLRTEHIRFHLKKMKVYLATQALSKSVASAIEFCDTVLQNPEFSNSSATSEFLRTMDKAFDLLNSKLPFNHKGKIPLSVDNEEVWMSDFEKIQTYILQLHQKKPSLDKAGAEPLSKRLRTDDHLVVDGPRKRGFLGCLISLKSAQLIFETYVKKKNMLKYVLTYKLSQDHLEMFFGSIRSSLGLNNNPSAHQFKTAYRKLILGALHKGDNENCLHQDETEMVLPVNSIKATNFVNETFELQDSSTDIYMSAIQNNSEYKNSALNYIAGFVQKKVQEKEKCVNCSCYLNNCRIFKEGKFINFINRGGLIKPSKQVEKIVMLGESVFSLIVLKHGSPFGIPHLVKEVCVQVKKIIQEKYPDMLSELDDHIQTMGSHRTQLIEKICSCYISIRSKHYCSELSKKNIKIRVHSSKLVLFKHQ
jgi:hypothetical protein